MSLGGIAFNLIFATALMIADGPSSLIYTQFAIAIFNLLPVAPLDGSKILQVLLNKVISYKKSLDVLKVTNVIFLAIFALGVWSLRLEQYYLVVVVLAVLVGKFQAMVPYIYERYKVQRGEC
ncbi:MAG: site-2 protease family protein [Turicibacter sp.]|nr:site-2 protease family protein [Turicibacter sp.]